MFLQYGPLLLGGIGTVLALAHEVQRWLSKRAAGSVDEHRLDVEGLRTLVQEQRTELTDERAARRESDARVDQLEKRIEEMERLQRLERERHDTEVAELKRQLRRAEDALDRLRVGREMKR